MKPSTTAEIDAMKERQTKLILDEQDTCLKPLDNELKAAIELSERQRLELETLKGRDTALRAALFPRTQGGVVETHKH